MNNDLETRWEEVAILDGYEQKWLQEMLAF